MLLFDYTNRIEIGFCFGFVVFGFYWFFGLSASYSNVLWVFVFCFCFLGFGGSLEHNYDNKFKKLRNELNKLKKLKKLQKLRNEL